MFGGVVDKDTTKELWVYDLSSNLWTLKNYNSTPPVAVASHSAHVINGVMYILFGYSPIYGYKNRIQEYFIGTVNYQIVYFEHNGIIEKKVSVETNVSWSTKVKLNHLII